MKKLFIIVILSLAHFSPLRPMQLFRQKTPRLHSLPKMNKSFAPRFYSRKTNIAASLSNIIAAGATGYPLLLLPIVPQTLYEIATKQHTVLNRQRNESQAYRDLDFLIKTNGTTINHIQELRNIGKKIDVLKRNYEPGSWGSQQLIDEDSTFYTKSFQQKIIQLEKQKIQLTSSIIQEMSPFFTTYTKLNIADCLEDAEKHLNRLKNLHIFTQLSGVSALSLAILPYLYRQAANSQSELDEWTTAASMAMLILIELGCSVIATDGMPLSVQLAYWASLGLSTKAAFNNAEISTNIVSKIDQQCADLEDAIEILKIQQAHNKENEK